MTTSMYMIGNLTKDPVLRFTQSGLAVAQLRLASSQRVFDEAAQEWKDINTVYLDLAVWREQAENVTESLQTGHRVIVVGKLKQSTYETKEGEKRTALTLEVEEMGPSLKGQICQISKSPRRQQAAAGRNAGNAAPQQQAPAAAAQAPAQAAAPAAAQAPAAAPPAAAPAATPAAPAPGEYTPPPFF